MASSWSPEPPDKVGWYPVAVRVQRDDHVHARRLVCRSDEPPTGWDTVLWYDEPLILPYIPTHAEFMEGAVEAARIEREARELEAADDY